MLIDLYETTGKSAVFLSGDVHCSFVARLRVTRENKQYDFFNVVCSALNWPIVGLSKRNFLWGAGGIHVGEGKADFSAVQTSLFSQAVHTKNNFAIINASQSDGVTVSIFRDDGRPLEVVSFPLEMGLN